MTHQQIYDIIRYSIELPTFLGPIHRTMLIFTLVASILVALIFKNAKDRTVRIFLMSVWVLVFIMQIYRQITYSVVIVDGVLGLEYQFAHLPLQVCSVQLYAIPFVALLKNGRLRDSFIALMCIWSFFGGLGVSIYPGTLFDEVLGLTLQSLIHHSIQVILGVMLAIRYCHRMNKHYFFGGFILFMIYFAIAMVANITIHDFIVQTGRDDSINMFFLSPYEESFLPILETIRQATSHTVMVLTYMAGFTFLAVVIYKLQYRLTENRRQRLALNPID
ncbi:MAG: YwaF family protein [Clostridia bacterium]|nr:YwaF family protein [Clostridia bacterium]